MEEKQVGREGEGKFEVRTRREKKEKEEIMRRER